MVPEEKRCLFVLGALNLFSLQAEGALAVLLPDAQRGQDRPDGIGHRRHCWHRGGRTDQRWTDSLTIALFHSLAINHKLQFNLEVYLISS